MRKLKKLYFLLIFVIVGLSFILVCRFFCCDSCFLLKPLPQNISLKIRMDAHGDGHFGSPRKSGRKHQGIDLQAPLDTPVLAAKSGLVIKTDYDKYSGYYVVIWHWPNLKSYYLHLPEIEVKKWQPVKQGQVIGRVGRTGNARPKGIKPHLHFEIRENGIPQDVLKRWNLSFLIREKVEMGMVFYGIS